MQVLAAVPAEAERHGLDLLRVTRLSSRALYVELLRLERAGLIESRWAPSGRRGYRLTAAGLAVAAQRPAETAGTAATPGTAATAGITVTAGITGTAATGATVALPGTAETAATGGTVALRRAGWWMVALAIALGQSYAALARPVGDRLADLDVYVGAVNGLRHGASLYDFATAAGAPFTYPPFAGLVLFPVALPTIGTLRVLWTAATVATVVLLAVMVGRAGRPAWPTPAITAVLLASAPVSSDLRFGQVSIGLAVLVVLDTLGPTGRHRGVLTGLAAAVKLTPLIFIPMLWCTGRHRAAVTAASTFAVAVSAAGVVLPGDSWRFWTVEVWRVGRIGDLASAGNQSLTGAFMRLGIEGSVQPLLQLVAMGAVGALALRRAGALGRDGDWLSAMVVVGAAGVALSPVSWTHHQVWTVLAAFLPVRGPTWARRAWCGAVLAIMALPVASLGGPLWTDARLFTALAAACLVPLARQSAVGSPRITDAIRQSAAP